MTLRIMVTDLAGLQAVAWIMSSRYHGYATDWLPVDDLSISPYVVTAIQLTMPDIADPHRYEENLASRMLMKHDTWQTAAESTDHGYDYRDTITSPTKVAKRCHGF